MTEKIVAIGSLIAALGGAGWHLNEFEEFKATVEYHRCIEECRQACKENGIPIDDCRCSHCSVYK